MSNLRLVISLEDDATRETLLSHSETVPITREEWDSSVDDCAESSDYAKIRVLIHNNCPKCEDGKPKVHGITFALRHELFDESPEEIVSRIIRFVSRPSETEPQKQSAQ